MTHRYDLWASDGAASAGTPEAAAFKVWRSGGRIDPSALARAAGQDSSLLDEIGITPAELPHVPPASLFLSFKFILSQPYLSKDDRRMHPHDNPIRREWAFRAPMVAATTWKGNVRGAAKLLVEAEANKERWGRRLERLLGPAKREADEDDHPRRKGRVIFFPSYFDRAEADILNPRRRRTRTGGTPINLEQVPVGSSARLALLYAPLDLLGAAEAEIRAEREMDLTLLGTALGSALIEFGFGAKKTSGAGTAEEILREVVLQDADGVRCLLGKTAADLTDLANWGRQ
jgi:CRISPR-associated protein Cmr2